MTDNKQFTVCWNKFNTILSTGFHELLIRGDQVDVTLAADGQLLKAHRLVLSVCSPYFRKMFSQIPVNQHAFVVLNEVSHSTLQHLVQFMYCGEVQVMEDDLPTFIRTAEALQVEGIAEAKESAPVVDSRIRSQKCTTNMPSLKPSPLVIPTVRSHIQSYRSSSDEGTKHEKAVQPTVSASPASPIDSTVTSHSPLFHLVNKRILQNQTSSSEQPIPAVKRTEMADSVEPPSPPMQIQTIQTQQPSSKMQLEMRQPETIKLKTESFDDSDVELIEPETDPKPSERNRIEDSGNPIYEIRNVSYDDDDMAGIFDEDFFLKDEDLQATGGGGVSVHQPSSIRHPTVLNLDNHAINIGVTPRGKTSITIDGFCYVRNAQKRKRIYWECAERFRTKCPARIGTTVDGPDISHNGRGHTHPPEH